MTLTETDILDESKLTPMMAQWHACKKAAGDAILFFRMGDFYEAFYEDAIALAREVDLTLTKRQNIPMAGIPWHTSEAYIDKLIAKGLRVAIAEQTEDPKFAKGLVKREVVRVVTPGTVMNSSLLNDKSNNFFASIVSLSGTFGLAFLDLTTGEFRSIEFTHEHELLNEVSKIDPAELLISKRLSEKHKMLIEELQRSNHFLINIVDDWHFEGQNCYDFLVSHFKVHNLDGFGLKGMNAATNSAGALLKHLREILCLNVDHIEQISAYSTSQYMSLDRAAQRNLELTESLNEGNKKSTLLGVLDETLTPMGGRLLRQWIKQPLLSLEQIFQRQDGVAAFVAATQNLAELRQQLDGVRDLERLTMRISSGCCTPRDLLALKISLEPIPQLKILLQQLQNQSHLIFEKEQSLNPLSDVTQLISRALVDEPPLRINEGGIFRAGYHAELDELRNISHDSKSWIAQYQTQLRESSGIKTLKIGFTKIFGYYIEVSKGQAERTPDTFLRRQTLVNAQRYITPELKDYESKVLNAEERMAAMESELFVQLRVYIAGFSKQILAIAQALAVIDCLQSLGFV
ncbi:MAG: DNA mismatch repair protein MutS, partial [Parachlamydiaceae bacterium]|nr:DNA mismatch repair protein MutS [Parachlamydiaceae bacterium]